MSMTVSFRGGESTGGVADKQIETAKKETTGGVGARRMQDSIFLKEEPKCDTVCFRGYENENQQKKSSTGTVVASLIAGTAVVVGLLGLAHKYNIVEKYIIKENAKDFLKYSDKVTEPCYQACKWIKNNAYDKVVNFVKTKI